MWVCKTSSFGRAGQCQEGSFRGRMQRERAVRNLSAAIAEPMTTSGGAIGGGGCCHGEPDSAGILEGGGE
uniref:Uncharacterized protein n=1 Tax=Arundo donax TaxID=35708 RepID=A0A0A9HCT0_ARUDO